MWFHAPIRIHDSEFSWLLFIIDNCFDSCIVMAIAIWSRRLRNRLGKLVTILFALLLSGTFSIKEYLKWWNYDIFFSLSWRASDVVRVRVHKHPVNALVCVFILRFVPLEMERDCVRTMDACVCVCRTGHTQVFHVVGGHQHLSSWCTGTGTLIAREWECVAFSAF